MSCKQTVQRGEVEFDLYEKSIRVTSPQFTVLVFFGRDVDCGDTDCLNDLIEMGKRLKTEEIRKVLA